ncbi:MAG TPA: 1,4-alpha-glucan branching enzyme, partial [Rudaea sp.]
MKRTAAPPDIDALLAGSDASRALAQGRLADAFSFLGAHRDDDGVTVRAWFPGAQAVAVVAAGKTPQHLPLRESATPGLFVGRWPKLGAYRLQITWPSAIEQIEDAYTFGLLLGDEELREIHRGGHRIAGSLGAHPMTIGDVPGTRFAVWAPNAQRVSVVGDFNSWDGRRHPMRLRHEAGVWEIFLPRIGVGQRYKYEIVGANGQLLPLKADPFARYA